MISKFSPNKVIGVIILVIVSAGLLFLAFKSHNNSKKPVVEEKIPQTTTFTIKVGNLDREYLLYGRPDGSKSLPVVIVLHGGGGPVGSAELMAQRSGWVEKAKQEGFLAVFPQGVIEDPSKPVNLTDKADAGRNIRSWNDGDGITPASKKNIDDVAFLRTNIEDLENKFSVDEDRIYVTGFSNGASMAFRLGVELSDRIAAIAPVAGALFIAPKQLNSSVSLLRIVGGGDPLPTGGRSIIPVVAAVTNSPARDPVSVWATLLECPKGKNVSAGKDVRQILYSPCMGGAEVVDFVIDGMGHVYPGLSEFFGADPKLGDRVNATDLVWDFFKNHAKGQ